MKVGSEPIFFSVWGKAGSKVRIERQYEIWKATADRKDDSRPVLHEVLVVEVPQDQPKKARAIEDPEETPEPEERQGLAIAADGCIMAVVPVVLEEGDVPGLVKGAVIEAASKAQGRIKHLTAVTISLGEKELTYRGANGERITVDRTIEGQFPPYERIIPARPTEPFQFCFGLDARLYLKLCQAVGLESLDYGYPHLTTTGVGCACLVEKLGKPANGKPEAPFGVIMPLCKR